jgi:hypothetical protein
LALVKELQHPATLLEAHLKDQTQLRETVNANLLFTQHR